MKKGVMIFSAILSVILLTGLVAAATTNLPAPPINSGDVSKVFNAIFNPDATGAYGAMVARLLVFILLSIVLFKPAKKITGDSEGLGWLVAAIVSIMAVRFLDVNIVRGLFLPYEALGVTLSVVIPFLLMFWFLEFGGISKFFRNMIWGFYFLALFVLWYLRWTNIGDLAYVYAAAGVAALLVLLFDNKIQGALAESGFARQMGMSARIAANVASQEYENLAKQLVGTHDMRAQADIMDRMHDLEKTMKALAKKTSI